MRAYFLVTVVVSACSSSPLPAEQSPPPGAAAADHDYAAMCPVLADTRPIGGTPASVAGDAVTADLAGLRAAIPTAPAGWTVVGVQDVPRGMAGHASSSVVATLSRGPDQVRLELLDLVHVCRCQPGDGVRLRDRELATRPGERAQHDVGDRPGLTETRAGGGAMVQVWVSDRCLVSAHGAAVSDLVPIVESLSWATLAAACGPVPR